MALNKIVRHPIKYRQQQKSLIKMEPAESHQEQLTTDKRVIMATL